MTESPFAPLRCYLLGSRVEHDLDQHYPVLIAPTGSCAKAGSSVSLCIRSDPQSLQVAVSPCCIQLLPSVILQICPRIPGPLPRWLTRCVYPLLPLSRRPSPQVHWVGSTTILRSTTSERGTLTRLQSFDNLQASEFACHPDRSHRWPPMWMPGRPWRLHPSRTRFVTSPRIGYASRPKSGN